MKTPEIKYFSPAKEVQGYRLFSITTTHKGHTYIVTEAVKMSDMARMDIDNVEKTINGRLLNRLIEQMHKEIHHGSV